MTEASAQPDNKEFEENIYNSLDHHYDEQQLFQSETESGYFPKNYYNVGTLNQDPESQKSTLNGVRITRSKLRPSSAYGRGHYYGGYDRPINGRKDTYGYYHGKFVTGYNARNDGWAGWNGQDPTKWNNGYQTIVNSIQKVASGEMYSKAHHSKVRIEDGYGHSQANTFDNEMDWDHTRGQAPPANGKSVRFDGYRAPRRPQSALGPRYRGLTRAQSTPFFVPGAGQVDDNHTFQDFESHVSEKTNKLKKNLYGKRYGYYSNRPLTTTGKRRKRPLIGSRKGPRGQSHGRQLAISKDLRNFYEEKNFRDSLYFDSRTGEVPKRKGNNKMIEGLMRYRKTIEGQPHLHHAMMKLKDINLLKDKKNKVRITKHWPHKGYIYNDYHDKSTKDGYNRNALGTFYYH